MKDRSAKSNNHKPPQEFAEYLQTLLTEVLINGEKLSRFTKWLKKYCDEYGVEFEIVKTEVEDFIELMDEYNKASNSVVKKSLNKSGKNLFLTISQINKLISDYNKIAIIPKETSSSKKDEERKKDWEDAKIEDTTEAYQDFIDKYETGKFIPTATRKLKDLERVVIDDKLYNVVENKIVDKSENEINYKSIFGWIFLIVLIIVILIDENGGCN